jgi:hypothetical protein
MRPPAKILGNWSQFVTSSVQYIDHVSRLPRHRPIPFSESAMLIHSLDPNLQKRPLGFVLIGVVPFRFENEFSISTPKTRSYTW